MNSWKLCVNVVRYKVIPTGWNRMSKSSTSTNQCNANKFTRQHCASSYKSQKNTSPLQFSFLQCTAEDTPKHVLHCMLAKYGSIICSSTFSVLALTLSYITKNLSSSMACQKGLCFLGIPLFKRDSEAKGRDLKWCWARVCNSCGGVGTSIQSNQEITLVTLVFIGPANSDAWKVRIQNQFHPL